jgi:hypothetical protein
LGLLLGPPGVDAKCRGRDKRRRDVFLRQSQNPAVASIWMATLRPDNSLQSLRISVHCNLSGLGGNPEKGVDGRSYDTGKGPPS